MLQRLFCGGAGLSGVCFWRRGDFCDRQDGALVGKAGERDGTDRFEAAAEELERTLEARTSQERFVCEVRCPTRASFIVRSFSRFDSPQTRTSQANPDKEDR